MLQGRRYTFNLKNKKTPKHTPTPQKHTPHTQKHTQEHPPKHTKKTHTQNHTKNNPKTTQKQPKVIPIPFRYHSEEIPIPFQSHFKTTQTPPKNRPKTAQKPSPKPYFSFSTLSFFTLPIFTHLDMSRRLKMCGVTPFPPTNALHPRGGHPLFFLAEYALPLLSTACHS